MEQLEGTKESIYNTALWARTLGEDKCTRGETHNVCVRPQRRNSHRFSLSLYLPDPLLSLMSSATPHTLLVIKACQISPYHTLRGIHSCTDQSAQQACHKRCTQRTKHQPSQIKRLLFTLNLTFNCKLIIHPCAKCSVLNDQRTS